MTRREDFVNPLRKQRGSYTQRNALHIFAGNHIDIITPFAGCVFSASRQVKTVKRHCAYHVAFNPMGVCIVRSRKSMRRMQNAMPPLLCDWFCSAQRDDNTQIFGNTGKNDYRALFVHLRINASMKITKQDRARSWMKFYCHSAPRKPYCPRFVKKTPCLVSQQGVYAKRFPAFTASLLAGLAFSGWKLSPYPTVWQLLNTSRRFKAIPSGGRGSALEVCPGWLYALIWKNQLSKFGKPLSRTAALGWIFRAG